MAGLTQLLLARAGRISPAMRRAAKSEGVAPEQIRIALASGKAVVPCNPIHTGLCPVAIGRQFRTKINANIGRSGETSGLRIAQNRNSDQCRRRLRNGPQRWDAAWQFA